MKPSFANLLCSAALSALACVALAQNSPPQSPPYPTPFKAPSPESPQNTTNAAAQAEADYKAARAKCDMKAQNERQACINEAEEHFYSALAGTNPDEQGNPGSSATETGK